MLSEKEIIEHSTIDGFLAHYNKRTNSDFRVVRYAVAGQVPDAICKDTHGQTLNIEVTLTEDRSKDIQAFLGRSDHLSIETVSNNLKLGLGFPESSTLLGNVMDQIVVRVTRKLSKRYGPATALVVRDASPLPWKWDDAADQLRSRLDLSSNPFDRGIWILDREKTSLFQIVGGTA